MTAKPKFLEFSGMDEAAFRYWADCNSEDIIDAKNSFAGGLRYQHSRDRIIMEKLLEANRVLRDCLKKCEEWYEGYGEVATIQDAIAKADKIMRSL